MLPTSPFSPQSGPHLVLRFLSKRIKNSEKYFQTHFKVHISNCEKPLRDKIKAKKLEIKNLSVWNQVKTVKNHDKDLHKIR